MRKDQREGDQLEYFSTSLHCFPCSPKNEQASSPTASGKNSVGTSTLHCVGQYMANAAAYSLINSSQLCVVPDEWLCSYMYPFAVKRHDFQMQFSGMVLSLQLKPGAVAGSTERPHDRH